MSLGEFRGSLVYHCGLLASISLILAITYSCNKDMEIFIEEQDNIVIITPDDYKTISNVSKELLSCGPVSIADENGTVSVVYLADEESCVESEFSPSIFLRVSRFNINDYQANPEFVDVARPNETLFGHYTGATSPYEPNLLRTNDGPVIMYRDGGMGGDYLCCDFDSDLWACSSFRNMTIDGQSMTPSNVRSIYEQLSGIELEKSPVLVFTTRIVRYGNLFISHLGGYNYNGIIVKSSNGKDWESITIPPQVEGLSYILEGAVGVEQSTGNFFLCARGNSVALYHFDCDFNVIAEPRFLSGVTTSKPTFFNYHGSLYLIVNMQNDMSFSIGRRNTANIYKVNGRTGELTLSKSLKCKDGCSYHSVQVIGDDIWMVFQTDARHLALEKQGRSNLALYKLNLD